MPSETPLTRVRLALDLHETGVRMYAQRLRREQPGASDEDIRRQVHEWLADRPMDAPGRLRTSHS